MAKQETTTTVTLETQALDIVNVGVGLLQASQETAQKLINDAQKAIQDAKVSTEKGIEDFKKNAIKAYEDLKAKGALDKSEPANKVREFALNAARKIS